MCTLYGSVCSERRQALYRLGMHAQAAEIYAEMYAEEDEKRGDADRGFPAVSVNLAAAYAAAGKAVEALKRFPVEDVRQGKSFWKPVPCFF